MALKAAILSVGAGRSKNWNDDFPSAPAVSEGCNSVQTPLRNSNDVSGSGLKNVS